MKKLVSLALCAALLAALLAGCGQAADYDTYGTNNQKI